MGYSGVFGSAIHSRAQWFTKLQYVRVQRTPDWILCSLRIYLFTGWPILVYPSLSLIIVKGRSDLLIILFQKQKVA